MLGSSVDTAQAPGAVLGLVPLADVEELSWQEQALCAQTDPEAFFPEKVEAPAKPRKYVFPVKSALTA